MSLFDQLVQFGKEHPIQAALYAGLFTWFLTALGVLGALDAAEDSWELDGELSNVAMRALH